MAEEMDMDMETYYKVVSRAQGVGILSLDEPIQDTSMSKLSKQVSEEPSPLDELRIKELKRAVAAALATLKSKEKLVMSLYYYEELTLREIADVLGLTESRISQIHSKAMIKLRARLRDYYQI
jgi:RNA polymerase sigma factor for flagellar operon FliA